MCSEDSDAQLTAETARTALEHQPQVLLGDTHQQSAVLVQLLRAAARARQPTPSRHLVRLAWGGRQLDSLDGSRPSTGRLFDSQTGFVPPAGPGARRRC